MKLIIDTKTDTKEEIRKAIRFLQTIINEKDFRKITDRKFPDLTDIKKDGDDDFTASSPVKLDFF
jgi:hypothetical protein